MLMRLIASIVLTIMLCVVSGEGASKIQAVPEISGCTYHEVEYFSNPDVLRGNLLTWTSSPTIEEYSVWSLEDQSDDYILPYSVHTEYPSDPRAYGANPPDYLYGLRRKPELSPDRKYISYATLHARSLTANTQYVWSFEDRYVVLQFDWLSDWIHFIGWFDTSHLAFLYYKDGFGVDIIDLSGHKTDAIELPNLKFTINSAPWAPGPNGTVFADPSFFLISAFASNGNMLLWTNSDNPESAWLYVFNVHTLENFLIVGKDRIDPYSFETYSQFDDRFMPQWSHSGDLLALPFSALEMEPDNLSLLSVGADRKAMGLHQITDLPDRIPFHPRWSYNDRSIAFIVPPTAKDPERFYLLDVRTNSLTEINTGIPIFGSDFVRAPHGNYLIYFGEGQQISSIVVVDIDNCEFTRVPVEDLPFPFIGLVDWFTTQK